MSNFHGHRNGGVLAMLIVISLLAYASHANIFPLSSMEIILSGVLALLFALFTDLDTKSTPSKFFYLIVICFLGWLYTKQEYRIANVTAIFALIPQVMTHRGILHSRISSIVIPGSMLMLHFFGDATLNGAIAFSIAGIIGYNVHLLLDGK